MDDLTDALVATGATIAFDAIGGGKLAGQILDLHGERRSTRPPRSTAATARACTSRSTSTAASISADRAHRAFGMAWGVGGWLLFPFLQKIGPATAASCASACVAELKTTFASHYTQEISLAEALQPRRDRRLRQARDRREVPDQSEQGAEGRPTLPTTSGLAFTRRQENICADNTCAKTQNNRGEISHE